MQTIEIPYEAFAPLSFMSEILGAYDTYSYGMITWDGSESIGCYFAALLWNAEGVVVEITDGGEPFKGGANTIYTLFGYCRYHGIRHRLLGATLPVVSPVVAEEPDEASGENIGRSA